MGQEGPGPPLPGLPGGARAPGCERPRRPDQEVGEGGVFRATQGLLAEFGADRCIDTPLAESAIVGVAIGASLNGIVPIAEIQFADFIPPAMDQSVNEAARLRYRSNG